jgi:hypothetical protein
MRAGWLVAAALALAPIARADDHQGPADADKTRQDQSSQGHPGGGDRGLSGQPPVEGQRAGRSGETGPQGPGLEQGTADGMAGGRTDRGPKGQVGITDDPSTGKAKPRARPRRVRKSAPQRADVEGGGEGTHQINRAEPLREEGERVPAKAQRRRSTAETEQPGGSGPEGISGHRVEPQSGQSSSGGAQGPAPAPESTSK